MAHEWIRDYDRVRPVLERIYTYGYYSREDFERQGIAKKSSYDKELQRLQSILPRGRLLSRSDGKRKLFYIKRDYFSNRAPWLAASYFLHSIKPVHVSLALLALARLPMARSKLQQTAEQLPGIPASDITTTLWRQLARLEKLGYLRKEGKQYRRPRDPLSVLDREELDALYQLSDFFACSGFPRTPGEFLRRGILREYYARGLDAPPETFLFRENCCRSIFDEQLVFALARACRERLVTQIFHRGTEYRTVPVSFQIDVRLGRWYLLCMDTDTGAALRLRLRDITKHKITPDKFRDENRLREALAQFSHTYLSTTASPPVLVEAELLVPEDSPVFQQFKREIFIGEITREERGVFYRASVRDPVELKPLLRSYFPYLKILPGSHGLDRSIREELERMRARYAAVP